jgi:hypothetical protein
VNQHPFAHSNSGRELIETQIKRAARDERSEAAFGETFWGLSVFGIQGASISSCATMYHMVQIVYHLVQKPQLRGVFVMKSHNYLLLFIFGSIFWALGTLYYQAQGSAIFETTSLRYWVNFILAPVSTALVCVAIFRWREIRVSQWASAAVMLALPGLLGEAILLSHFARWMPRMQASSAGRYGAFLFAMYALLLGAAELASIRAST